LGACALAMVGQIRDTGEGVVFPANDSGLLVQTGLRFAVTQMLGRRAHLTARAEGVASLTRGVVTLDSVPVWTTPRVAGLVGLDFGVRFP
jgi:hypothetical protein